MTSWKPKASESGVRAVAGNVHGAVTESLGWFRIRGIRTVRQRSWFGVSAARSRREFGFHAHLLLPVLGALLVELVHLLGDGLGGDEVTGSLSGVELLLEVDLLLEAVVDLLAEHVVAIAVGAHAVGISLSLGHANLGGGRLEALVRRLGDLHVLDGLLEIESERHSCSLVASRCSR